MDTAADTAARVLLALLPEHKRAAAGLLIPLPADLPVCGIGGDCEDLCDNPDDCPNEHPEVGKLTAGVLLSELVADVASPECVVSVMDYHRRSRRGLRVVK